MILSRVIAATVLATCSFASAADAPATQPSKFTERLVFFQDNLQRPENREAIMKVVDRAAASGYTHIVITDSKSFRWKEWGGNKGYIQDAQKVRQHIKDKGLKFVAICCDQGSDLLSNDPSLAEGTPVVDAPFVIKGGQLTPADSDFQVANRSFEQEAGWSLADSAKRDESVAAEGKASLCVADPEGVNNGNASAKQTINVKPFRYYYLSAKVKTQDFEKAKSFDMTLRGNTNGQGLSHRMYGVKQTQDWTTIETTFNTLDNTQVVLALGMYGGGKGKLWVDDLRVEPAGIVNLVRREKLPVKITSADGKTVYEEGKDLEKVVDPKANMGKWPGYHDIWPAQKPVVKTVEGGRLKDGDELRLSYYISQMAYGWGVFACPNEPRTMELVKWQVEQIHQHLQPDAYMMAHDEIRHWGWDPSCEHSGKTLAQTMADNVRKSYEIIQAVDPGKPVYVWSDMFDPTHNARKNNTPYYLCKGVDPFYGSWEGLDPKVNVIIWWAGNPRRAEVPAFFANRGHKVLLSNNFSDTMPGWMEEAYRSGNAIGTMFTVWNKDYSKIEAFGKMLDEWKPGVHAIKPVKPSSDLE